VIDQPAMIGVRVVDAQTLSALGSWAFNDNVILGLGDIDRCQSGVGTRIVGLGHGGIPPSV